MRIFRLFMCALLLAVFGNLPGPPAQCADNSPNSAKELRRINREMAEKKKALTWAKRREHSVLTDLDKLDRGIQASSSELADRQRQLREAETTLQGIEKSNAELDRELSGLKRLYGLRLRALYKMQHNGAAAIFFLENTGSALKQIKYLGLIAERDRTVMTEYRSALDRLVLRQREITGKKEEILRSRQSVAATKAGLETKRLQKAALLASIRQEKGLYTETLRELEASSASLWAMIKRDEETRRSAQKPPPSAPGGRETFVRANGRLPWPLEGRVLTRFGMQRHPQFGTMVFRRGIEIEAREGQEVRAVKEGEVVYADWYKGYGKLLIIDHGNGFYTLYGYLSRLDLVKGDRVAKGQVIGLAGETGSLRGAKLYFEVRRNGEAEDPLSLLARK